ncbi:hypothetical protein, partial [Streptosporangium amethystogenes]
ERWARGTDFRQPGTPIQIRADVLPGRGATGRRRCPDCERSDGYHDNHCLSLPTPPAPSA